MRLSFIISIHHLFQAPCLAAPSSSHKLPSVMCWTLIKFRLSIHNGYKKKILKTNKRIKKIYRKKVTNIQSIIGLR